MLAKHRNALKIINGFIYDDFNLILRWFLNYLYLLANTEKVSEFSEFKSDKQMLNIQLVKGY